MRKALTFWLSIAVVLGGGSCATMRQAKTGDGKLVATADGHCVDLQPESALHPVKACETPEFYELTAGGRRVVAAKPAFRARLRERLLQFVKTTPYPWRALRAASIEVWMTAPVFEPEAASLVAVVTGGQVGANFAVHLPLDPALWDVTDERVVLLGEGRYPSAAAKRAARIAIQPRGHVTAARLAGFLAATGLYERRDLTTLSRPDLDLTAWQPAEIATRPFAEAAAAQLIMRHSGAKAHVGAVALLPAAEREGPKAMAFAFRFDE